MRLFSRLEPVYYRGRLVAELSREAARHLCFMGEVYPRPKGGWTAIGLRGTQAAQRSAHY